MARVSPIVTYLYSTQHILTPLPFQSHANFLRFCAYFLSTLGLEMVSLWGPFATVYLLTSLFYLCLRWPTVPLHRLTWPWPRYSVPHYWKSRISTQSSILVFLSWPHQGAFMCSSFYPRELMNPPWCPECHNQALPFRVLKNYLTRSLSFLPPPTSFSQT